jgi:GntR family transcriptional regulator
MLLNLTDLSSEPLQSQIVRQIRVKILAGELTAAESLPSIRKLARQQHISVITVQRAYESLEREGLIYSRRGKGFFVSDLPLKAKLDMARIRFEDNIEPHIRTALEEGMDRDGILKTIERILGEFLSK